MDETLNIGPTHGRVLHAVSTESVQQSLKTYPLSPMSTSDPSQPLAAR